MVLLFEIILDSIQVSQIKNNSKSHMNAYLNTVFLIQNNPKWMHLLSKFYSIGL